MRILCHAKLTSVEKGNLDKFQYHVIPYSLYYDKHCPTKQLGHKWRLVQPSGPGPASLGSGMTQSFLPRHCLIRPGWSAHQSLQALGPLTSSQTATRIFSRGKKIFRFVCSVDVKVINGLCFRQKCKRMLINNSRKICRNSSAKIFRCCFLVHTVSASYDA